jgi:hypothetical protein
MIWMKVVYPTALKMTWDVVKAVADVAEPVMAGAIVEVVGLDAATKLVTAVGVVMVMRHPGWVLKDVCTARSAMLRLTMMPLI